MHAQRPRARGRFEFNELAIERKGVKVERVQTVCEVETRRGQRQLGLILCEWLSGECEHIPVEQDALHGCQRELTRKRGPESRTVEVEFLARGQMVLILNGRRLADDVQDL